MGTLLLALLVQTQDQIDRAVRKGVEVLKNDPGELATLARVIADPSLDSLRLPTPTATRSAALQAMIYEEFSRLKSVQRIGYCVQQLIDTQCRDGLWDVGRAVDLVEIPKAPPTGWVPGEKPVVRWKHKLVRRGEGGREKGDPENARWALDGLFAGYHAGLIPPAEVVEKAERAWREGARDPADVVYCLSICLDLQNRNWKKDPDILKALERLAAEQRTEPKALYGLKRAMLQFGSDKLGDVEWRPRATKILQASQKEDGSWGSIEDTAYATLTLHHAVRLLHGVR